MKRIFACIFALVMLLTLCACDSFGEGEPSTVPPVEMDIEVLRGEWRDGILTFANGGQVDLPCELPEFLEKSGFRVGNEEWLSKQTLEPDENIDFLLVGENTQIRVTGRNKTEEPITADKSTIVSYNFTNMYEGNRDIRFANSLTMNVTRVDVEDSLGLPDGATSEDKMYTYEGRDDRKMKVELRVSFNSNDMVNSVAFYVGAK